MKVFLINFLSNSVSWCCLIHFLMKSFSADTFTPQALKESFCQSLRPGQLMESLFDCVPGAFFFAKDRESRFMAGGQSFAKTLGE